MNLRKLFWVTYALLWLLIPILAFAKSEPPNGMMQHIMQQRIVHDRTCTVNEIKNVECFVFADDEQKMLWIVLFDKDITISHVFTLTGQTLRMVWVRDDLTT